MCSSSSTTPSSSSDSSGDRPTRAPSRRRTIITWGLVLAWCLLIAFAIVGQFDPPWLQSVSERGRFIEVSDIKNLGDDMFGQGDYRQAITQYLHALSIDPERVAVMVNLGISWIQVGLPDRGVPLLKEALQKTESAVYRGQIYHALALAAEQMHKRAEAIHYYELAAGSGTEVDKRAVALGRLFLEDGEPAKARDSFQRALDYRLDVRTSYQEMLLRAQDTFEDDSTHLAVVTALLDDLPSDEEMERYDLVTIHRVQDQDRDIAVLHNYAGWACVQMELWEEAAGHFEESLRIWPQNRNAVDNLRVIRQIQAGGAPPRGGG